jgi:capsular polysaccharide biosynthesis protein
MLNEDDLLEGLSRLGVPILKVNLEEYSFAEKVALFKGSKMVIGPHGANLSFLPFVNEGLGVLEIFGPHLQSPHYECMAYQCFLNYQSVGAEDSLLNHVKQPQGWEQDYRCSPNQIIECARALLGP